MTSKSGLEIAKHSEGEDEINDRYELRSFFKTWSINGDLDIDPSTTPWCAAFVNACERAAGFKGTGKLNARSFLKYGKEVKLEDAKEGDIAIFKRGNSNWEGHVTYFIEAATRFNSGNPYVTIECFGGNQGDKVCYANYRASDLLGIRRSE
jgi:uncharacterized protein (TIGR02594 family)